MSAVRIIKHCTRIKILVLVISKHTRLPSGLALCPGSQLMRGRKCEPGDKCSRIHQILPYNNHNHYHNNNL